MLARFRIWKTQNRVMAIYCNPDWMTLEIVDIWCWRSTLRPTERYIYANDWNEHASEFVKRNINFWKHSCEGGAGKSYLWPVKLVRKDENRSSYQSSRDLHSLLPNFFERSFLWLSLEMRNITTRTGLARKSPLFTMAYHRFSKNDNDWADDKEA